MLLEKEKPVLEAEFVGTLLITVAGTEETAI